MGGPQLLPVQIAERAHDLLEFVPRGDAGAELGLQGLRDVRGPGAPLRPTEAQREMRAMLGAGFTVATRVPAAAVGLGQSAEDDARGQVVQSSKEGAVPLIGNRHRWHQ